jgi:hypothetical protein
MNKEEQRIAIAKACGWSYRKTEFCTYWWNDEVNKTLPPNDDGFRPCPDYLNDLNAMHEAEKVLTSEQITSYVYSLESMNERWSTPAFATASQRAEAFLRTIGKWEESK